MANKLVDRDHFFKNFPSAGLDKKKLTASRREGCEAIFDIWDEVAHPDRLEWVAYLLATAWHETGALMLPVRESFAKTDAQAVARVTAFCKKKGIPNYAARNAKGKSFYGRGYVQLTHEANYKKMGKRLGLGDKLAGEPDEVMKPKISAQILALGLMEGLFRPKFGKLKDYFDGTSAKWTAARALVNGDVKKNGKMAGGYGKAFFGSLKNK